MLNIIIINAVGILPNHYLRIITISDMVTRSNAIHSNKVRSIQTYFATNFLALLAVETSDACAAVVRDTLTVGAGLAEGDGAVIDAGVGTVGEQVLVGGTGLCS